MNVGLGECIYIALKPIFKIYLIIGTGYFLVKSDQMSIETTKGVSSLVVNAIVPCLAFNKIVTNVSGKDIKTIGVIVLTSLILYTLGGVGAVVTNKILPVPRKWYYGLLFSGIFPNISDLPIAYLQSLATTGIFTEAQVDKGVAFACIFMGIQNFFQMNLGMYRMVGLDMENAEDIETETETETETEDVSLAVPNHEIEMGVFHTGEISSVKKQPIKGIDTPVEEYIRVEEGEDMDEEEEEEDSTSLYTGKRDFKIKRWLHQHKLSMVWFFMVNFCKPASIGVMLGIVVCMIPWVRALFVHTSSVPNMHQAPDHQPVLNFIMDYTSYLAQISVPMGLLLLGCTIGRLKIDPSQIPRSFFLSSLMMSIFRLCVIPVIGILWTNKIYSMNWIKTDISKFLIILTFAMPAATAQVYFTAMFSPITQHNNEEQSTQMNCLSIVILMQYCLLFFTLAVVLTYTLKVDLKI